MQDMSSTVKVFLHETCSPRHDFFPNLQTSRHLRVFSSAESRRSSNGEFLQLSSPVQDPSNVSNWLNGKIRRPQYGHISDLSFSLITRASLWQAPSQLHLKIFHKRSFHHLLTNHQSFLLRRFRQDLPMQDTLPIWPWFDRSCETARLR
jgi:hypothetical protein